MLQKYNLNLSIIFRIININVQNCVRPTWFSAGWGGRYCNYLERREVTKCSRGPVEGVMPVAGSLARAQTTLMMLR